MKLRRRCNPYAESGSSRRVEVNECWLKAEDDDGWTVITDCGVHMSVARRIQRTIVRGNEGDDILDEGAESAVFTITGSMSLDEYREILRIFRSGQAQFKDPFEEREASAIISNLEYEGGTGEYSIEITEDVDIEW